MTKKKKYKISRREEMRGYTKFVFLGFSCVDDSYINMPLKKYLFFKYGSKKKSKSCRFSRRNPNHDSIKTSSVKLIGKAMKYTKYVNYRRNKRSLRIARKMRLQQKCNSRKREKYHRCVLYI